MSLISHSLRVLCRKEGGTEGKYKYRQREGSKWRQREGAQIEGEEGSTLALRLRDRRAVGVARQFVQPRFSSTESKLAKSNLVDTK